MINTIMIWIILAILGPTIFETPSLAYWICGIFAGSFVLSFALAGLGVLWKKAFKIEEKTDKIFLENGYTVWEGNEEELSDKN